MDNIQSLKTALMASIQLEEESREFYLKAAKKSKNLYGKKVFEALADDETRHIVVMKEYCEITAKKKSAPKLCAVVPQHKDIAKRILLSETESEQLANVAVGADELKAYEIAMKMENKGYALYKESADKATDPDVNELYRFLMGEEEAHYDLLSNAYEYLKNPASWFTKEEKPIVEG